MTTTFSDRAKAALPTPRTDAAAIGFGRLLVAKDAFSVTELVDANFARQLERELAALKAENERLREALQLLLDHGYDGEGRNLSAMALARRALGEEEGR